MMKTKFTILILMLALVPAVFAQTSLPSFSANLTGANERPGPGDSDGTGLAVVTFDGTTVRYTIFVQDIAAPTMAHIHRGGPDVAGPIVINFNPTFSGGGAFGQVTGVEQSLINEILANPSGFYVNVHTGDFPNGAIRGQLAGGAVTEPGARTLYFPVVGKVPGAAGTNFVTDVRVINQTGSTANVTLDFFASSAGGQTAPTATRTITVAPGSQAVLDDVIATLNTSGLGGLRITSDQNITAIARVINDLRSSSQGTSGFATDALQLSEATTSATLGFLSQATDFRTNIGFFNPSSTPVTITFTARRSSDGAVLGSNTVTVPGFSQQQSAAFNVISNVPDADRVQQDFYVTWTSSGPVFVYASVNDNITGDPVLVR